MRVGRVNYDLGPFYTQLWELIEDHLRPEPIEWLTFNETFFSGSAEHVFELGLVDSMQDTWEVEDLPSSIHLTYPLNYPVDYFVMPLSAMEHKSTTWQMVSIFKWITWIAILVSILGILVTQWLSSVIHNQDPSSWNLFEYFTTQNASIGDRLPQDRSLITLICCLSLLTFHSLVLYQGCLLGALVRPPELESPVATIEELIDLIERKEVVLNLEHPRFPQALQVQKSRSDAMQRLRQALRMNPPIYVVTNRNSVMEYHQGKPVVGIVSTHFRSMYVNRTHCDYVFAQTVGFTRRLEALPTWSGNETIFRLLNDIILDNLSEIIRLGDEEDKKLMDEHEECLREKQDAERWVVGDGVDVRMLTGAFLFLGVGLLIALGVAVIEVHWVQLAGVRVGGALVPFVF